MNSQALSSQNLAINNKLKSNQKCRFADMEQLHKVVNNNQAMLKQLDPKAQKTMGEYKHIGTDLQKIKNQSLSSMPLSQFFSAVNFIFAHLQDSDFSLLSAIKANWLTINVAYENLQKSRTLTYQEMKLLSQFYAIFSKKGLNFGSFKTKLETFSNFQPTLERFEKDNSSVKSEDVDKLHAYLKSNQYLNQLNSQTRTAFEKHVKAVAAYNKTLNGLTDTLKEALKKMVDTNNSNATTFEILVMDKVVENLQDFPANKRHNFLVERDRLKREMTGYDANYTERSKKLFNEEIFKTIAYIVKQISEEATGATHYIEELMASVTITTNLLEFRTHKGENYAPYFHQGNDFDGNKHEGILYCPSKFPTKDGAMLEADEIFVLDVVKNESNPEKNYLTIVMVNHQKGIIFSTYHHVFHIYVKEGDKIKAGDKLGNYWKYIKTSDNSKIVGYANPDGKSNHLRGVASQGAFTIHHFPNQGDGKFPYFVKTFQNLYHMLDIGKAETLQEANFADRALKFKNEHFHVERRFVSKQEYLKKHFSDKENASLKNINLSQNIAKHFGEHYQLKTVALNSSFGKLLPASALLDTNSANSKLLLNDMVRLRENIQRTPYFKKNHGTLSKEQLEADIRAAKVDGFVRDYTTLIIFENIVKLACELRTYTSQQDNCNLSELQGKITKAKEILTTQKLPKIKK